MHFFLGTLRVNAGQKYCRMLQGEHSAILSIFTKLPFVIKIFVLSIFEWPFYTGFTVLTYSKCFKILNTFLHLFSIKMFVIRAGIPKMLARIANREDQDQTAQFV